MSARHTKGVASSVALSLVLLFSVQARAFDPLQRAERAVQRSRAAFAAGDTVTAIDEMLRAQALAPDDPRIRHALGEIYYEGTEYSSSQRVFERLVQEKDQQAEGVPMRREELLFNSANAAFEQEQYEEALELYTEALISVAPAMPIDENLLHNLELTQSIIEMQESQEHSGEGDSDENQQENQQEESDDSGDPSQQDQEDSSQEEQQSEQEQQQEQENNESEEQPEQAPADSTRSQSSEADSMSVAEADSLRPLPEGMTPQEAMRLLEALDHDEEELRRSIQRRLRGGETESTSAW